MLFRGWLVVALLLLTGSLNSGMQPMIIPNRPAILPLSEMSDEDYADFREGRLGDVIVRVEEGNVLRAKFFVVGNMLALDKNPTMSVRVLRTLFLRVMNEELQFSLDCAKWGAPHEIFRPNLAMMISVEHNLPSGAIAFFLESRE